LLLLADHIEEWGPINGIKTASQIALQRYMQSKTRGTSPKGYNTPQQRKSHLIKERELEKK